MLKKENEIRFFFFFFSRILLKLILLNEQCKYILFIKIYTVIFHSDIMKNFVENIFDDFFEGKEI